MRNIIILALVATIIVLLFTPHTDMYRHTLDVCNHSHLVTNGDNEQECGDLQTQTNTEYLCNNNGTMCWLELK